MLESLLEELTQVVLKGSLDRQDHSLVMFRVHSPPSKCKILLLDWTDSKPNPVLAGE